jgi:hypoxanthine phosphoribosyltransferase
MVAPMRLRIYWLFERLTKTKSSQVLIIDDLLGTGATLLGACELVYRRAHAHARTRAHAQTNKQTSKQTNNTKNHTTSRILSSSRPLFRDAVARSLALNDRSLSPLALDISLLLTANLKPLIGS